MVQRRAARFVYNDYSRYSHVSPMIKALGWDSLEYRRLINQVFMFYKIYKGLVGISLPPEISRNTRASRSPNCAPFHQLATLNDTYKYAFYPRAMAWRTLLVYTAKNHTLFGSFEIITNQIKEIFGKELKLKNFFPLNSFGPGYKIH